MRRGFIKNAGIFLAIIVVIGGGYWVWDRYFSEKGKIYRREKAQVEQWENYYKNYEVLMTADTYGGKTPQETLDLFVAALKKGDIELASKYFLLDDSLSREKWLENLKQTQMNNNLKDIINLISLARPAGSAIDGYFGFEVRDSSDTLISDINLQFNSYAKVWKIESL